MKKKYIIELTLMLLVILLTLTGCSSNNDSQNDIVSEENSNLSENTEGNIEDLDALADLEVERGLFDVTINMPKEFVGDTTQEKLSQEAKEKGFKEIKLNEDGSATYVMTKSQHKKLMKETKENFDKALQEMVGSENYPNFTKIETNDDFTDFSITTKSSELDLAESFSVIGFYMYGGMYAAFDGKTVDNIHVAFINEETGNIINESNSRDLADSE